MGAGITNQNILDVASTTFHDSVTQLFEGGVPGLYPAFVDVVPTASKVNEIDVMETMPVIRKWHGSKEFGAMRVSSKSVSVEKYEKSLEIDRLDLAADKTGLIARRIRAFLGQDGAQIYDKIATDALIAAATGYDGVSIFSTAHPRGPSGNQSNRGTTALSFAQHEAIMVQGASLRDENGEPLGISYDTLMVGPKLAALAREITQSTERVVGIDAAGAIDSGTRVAAAGIPNVRGLEVYTGGQMDLIVNPRLVGTYDDYYYHFDTSKGAKPFVLFQFRAPEGIEQMQMDAESRFLLDKFRMSVECDVVVCPAAWQVAHASIVA